MEVNESYATAATLVGQGRLAEAHTLLSDILHVNPDDDQALSLMARVVHDMGNLSEAIHFMEHALKVNLRNPAHLGNLGSLYRRAGKLPEAIACFEKLVQLQPRNYQAYFQLGENHYQCGNLDAAIGCYEKAVSIQPNIADIQAAIGRLQIRSGRTDLGIVSLEKAYTLAKGSAKFCADFADALRKDKQYRRAIQYYRELLMTPGDISPAEICANIGICHQFLGEISDAMNAFRQGLDYNPERFELRTNLLMACNYSNELSPEEVYAIHTTFDAAHTAALPRPSAYSNTPDFDRKLRIGYVSSNFYRHSVAHFILPVLEQHDRQHFEIHAYSSNRINDEITARIRQQTKCWHDVRALDDAALADMIRSDGIDILIDLNGHTADNRLMTFGRKPAPVQMTWLGYPNTTGMSAMDYRITDEITDPPGETERFYTEELVRLPEIFSSYGILEQFPPVKDTPSCKNGYITFGSFNNFAKVNKQVIDTWAGLLRCVSDSRLLIKSELFRVAASRAEITDHFVTAGISPERLTLINKDVSRDAHLARYGEIDIALDTFPYNGTTTTCEALWMGVPVVTLEGKTHAARVSMSQLTAIGLTECIADSREDYINTAATLAADTVHLSKLRHGMRDRLRTSPLMDATHLTSALELIISQCWRTWCANSTGRPSR